MSDVLKKHRLIWKNKKIIRDIYLKWYKIIANDMRSNSKKSIELGSGIGNFKEFYPDIIACDIVKCDWLDMCFDAHRMPFCDNSLDNIVMVDVLHHLANPIKFFRETHRCLDRGGRMLILEPFPSLFSLIIYKLFHPEPFVFNANYFDKQCIENKDPWDSNQAISYLLFYKHRNRFWQIFKGKFHIVRKKRMDCILYPLSGGFENRSLIPNSLIPLFKIFEKFLFSMEWLMAFRCYIVLEKL